MQQPPQNKYFEHEPGRWLFDFSWGDMKKKSVFILERAQRTAKKGFYPNWDQWTTEFIWVFIGILVRSYMADYRRHVRSFSSTWQERQLMKNISLILPEQIIEVSCSIPQHSPIKFLLNSNCMWSGLLESLIYTGSRISVS